MRYITFALAKGRLAKKAMDLLERTGITCEEMKDEQSRKLIFVNEELKLKFFLAKASDVPTYVEYGAADIGVVGKDTILEHGTGFYEILDLGFGRCRFALAGPKEKDFFSGYAVKTIATKYPNVARTYFEGKGMDVRIIKIEGSVELAPLLGLSDAIVDIVETGSTLKENGLKIIDDVAPISARLIANIASLKLRKAEIEGLAARMEESKEKKEEKK